MKIGRRVQPQSLHFSICDGLEHVVVQSNRSRLHQILSNLLTNAVKVSEKNERVELTCKLVNDSVVNESNENVKWVCFEVKDYGAGIPHSKIDSIFEPFIQLHNTNESKVPR